MKKRQDSGLKAIAVLGLLLVLCVIVLGLLVFRPVVISGTVFDDRNGDGIRQQREKGLPRRVIRLLNAAGEAVATTVCSRGGAYRFESRAAGSYRLVVTAALGSKGAVRDVPSMRRGEVTVIDVGIPPEEPIDMLDLRQNHDFWARKNGGDEDTERAVGLALNWLAEHQCGDGGWCFDLAECRNCRGKCRNSEAQRFDRTAATALALLPFLGRGISHKTSDPADARFQRTVARGIVFLQERVAPDGKVDGVREHWTMYSQGLAGIVLAEMCDIVKSDRPPADAKHPNRPEAPNERLIDEKALLADARRVLRYICRAQDQQGGWRYQPRQPGDTSVVGWQIMALHAEKKDVFDQPGTWKKAGQFFDAVQADEGATYGYTDNSQPSPRRSAIGLLCRMYDGWQDKHPALLDGVTRIAKVGPTQDLYFDYYATQVMFHTGGEPWKSWNEGMKKLLLDTQGQPQNGHEVGSWFEGVPSDLNGAGGRLYCTSLAAMILEVYHRHLRIYRPRD